MKGIFFAWIFKEEKLSAFGKVFKGVVYVSYIK